MEKRLGKKDKVEMLVCEGRPQRVRESRRQQLVEPHVSHSGLHSNSTWSADYMTV